MEKSVRRNLWGVRWRCSVNRILENLSLSLVIFGFAGLGLVITEKFFSLGLVSIFHIKILIAVTILTALVRWRVYRPSTMMLAMLLDERAGLRERTSTLLAFENTSDPFALAAIRESSQTLANFHPRDHFPLKFPTQYRSAIGIWMVTILAWMFLPQGDLLGKRAKRQEQAQQQVEIRQTQAQVNQAVKRVKELSEKVDDRLAKDLPKETAVQEPQKARQIALRQAVDLQKRVEQARSDPKFDGIRELQQRLKQLKSPDGGPSREFAKQLARGQFNKAAEALKSLQRKLAQENLTPEQRAQLAKQLDDLAKQIEQLARQQWKMDNELKRLGVDPKLATDLKKLQEALKKLPLSEEQRKKLMQMAAANQSACKSCKGLSGAMESASAGLGTGNMGQTSDGLAEASQQLDKLEALSQQLAMTESTMKDLSETVKQLGGEGTCSNCNGRGCSLCGKKGPWKAGLSDSESTGMGGPGHGQGQVADVKPTDTKTEKTNTKSNNQNGPTIASWYVEGSQVRGESQKGFSEVARAAEQEAAEAIDNQTIPREYQESVKKYFGQLHQTSQTSATQKGN